MKLCRLCFDICQEFDSIEGDLERSLIFCVPELDLKLTENPVMCKTCQSSLKQNHEFKKKCLSTQEKMIIFLQFEVKKSQVQVDVDDLKKSASLSVESIRKVCPIKPKVKKLSEETGKICFIKKRRFTENKEFHTRQNRNKSLSVMDDEKDILNLLDESDNVRCKKNKILESSMDNSNEFHRDTDKNNDFPDLNPYDCELCGESFENENMLENHKLIHSYKCDYCSFTTKYKIGLNKHYPICHKKRLNEEKLSQPFKENKNKMPVALVTLFKCKLCIARFTKKNSLSIHMIRKHGMTLSNYKCKKCNFQVGSKYRLLLHNKEVHKEKGKLIGDRPKPFSCNFKGCSREFATLKGKQIHQAVHGLKRKPCKICGLDLTKIEMRKHFLIHNKNMKGANTSKFENLKKTAKEQETEVTSEEKLEQVPPVSSENLGDEGKHLQMSNDDDPKEDEEALEDCSQATIISC